MLNTIMMSFWLTEYMAMSKKVFNCIASIEFVWITSGVFGEYIKRGLP